MDFETYGPYSLNFSTEPKSRWRNEFWLGVNYKEIETAIGCYAFLTRRGTKRRPWYVGQTRAKGGFADEIFEPHKVNIIQQIIATKHGVIEVALFPLMKANTYAFSKARAASKSKIDWVEKTLIGLTVAINPACENIKDTNFHRHVVVHGILGKRPKGRPWNDVKTVSSAFVRR